MSIHKSAASGYQSAANAYERGRPDYAPELLDWLRDDLLISRQSHCVDLGAGTGKFTARLTQLSQNITAIEPVAAMREKLLVRLPSAKALNGTAEKIPLPDQSIDALLVAQAFHWFATAQSVAGINRVLKPGGRLGLVWNVRDENVDWVAEITKIITPYEGDAPRYYKGDWKKVFPAPGFSPLETKQFQHHHTGHPNDVIINRFMSVSFIAAQDAATQQKIEDDIRDLIQTHPALKGKETISFPYVTECFWCTKTD
jgi:SAM-dependent methyltransferase